MRDKEGYLTSRLFLVVFQTNLMSDSCAHWLLGHPNISIVFAEISLF